MKYNYVYKIVNEITEEYYIGSHSTNDLLDNYFGSGVLLKYNINKYGKENFTFIMLRNYNNRSDMIFAEQYLIKKHSLKQNSHKLINICFHNYHNKLKIDENRGKVMALNRYIASKELVLFDHTIRRNDTGYFNLSDFAVIANKLRIQDGMSEKNTELYFRNNSSKEFLLQVSHEENILVEDLYAKKKGKNGGYWVHPLIFIDAAMWFSPELKVKVLKWVLDELILVRDEGGESFKDVMSMLTRRYPEVKSNPIWYKRIARSIYLTCGLSADDPNRWQKATKEQLQKRTKMHDEIKLMSQHADNISDCLIMVCNNN